MRQLGKNYQNEILITKTLYSAPSSKSTDSFSKLQVFSCKSVDLDNTCVSFSGKVVDIRKKNSSMQTDLRDIFNNCLRLLFARQGIMRQLWKSYQKANQLGQNNVLTKKFFPFQQSSNFLSDIFLKVAACHSKVIFLRCAPNMFSWCLTNSIATLHRNRDFCC